MNSHKFLLAILAHPMCQVFFKLMAFILMPVVSWSSPEPVLSGKSVPANGADSDNSKSIDSEDTSECRDLFPSIKSNQRHLTSSIQPCSTGLSTKLLPFKNNYGEIEWTFAEDADEESELSPHSANTQPKLSPTVSNSSNNESIISNKFNDTPNSLGSLTPSPPSTSSNSELKSHQCPHCEATFKLRGYLTRHIKKHALKKAYSCPFHKFLIYVDENNTTHKCHPTGGFSRRDTYKMHLKSRHFEYPEGTKSKQRGTSSGHCSMCGEFFASSEIWCELHIEGGECKFLPVGFKGKSRIKKRLEKQLRQSLKNNKRLIQNSSYEELRSAALMNKELLHAEIEKMSKRSSDSSSEESDQVMQHPSYIKKEEEVITFDEFKSHQFTTVNYEDYDDEFCLDVDQIGSFESQETYTDQQHHAPSMPIQQPHLTQPTPLSTPNGYQSSPYQSSFQSSPYQQPTLATQPQPQDYYNTSMPNQLQLHQREAHYPQTQYSNRYQQYYEYANPIPVHVQLYALY